MDGCNSSRVFWKARYGRRVLRECTQATYVL
nr:MAG TPA_asm: hypothetical protein [Caudoviricetes sp.]